MIYVIGSGPSAIAALIACVNLGKEVTVLDLGFTQETSFDNQAIKPLNRTDFPLKTTQGSDYPYWRAPDFSFEEENPLDILSSFAKGGFSTVWGAGLLPYKEAEFANWPFQYKEIKPYYEKLHQFLPVSGRKDELEDHFPLFTKEISPLKPSSQFEKIFDSFSKHQKSLNQAGLFLGQSRLAIQQNPQPCVFCGQCIEGCPKDLIYSSAHTLHQFLTSPLVTYRDGIKVEKIHSMAGEVDIHAYDLRTHEHQVFRGEKAFLGAGVLSSTKILLKSVEAYDRELEIKDSQYFLFPMLGPYSSNILKEDLFTLSQAFLEIENEAFFPSRIHLSLYGYSPYLRNFVYQKFGVFHHLLKPGLNFGLKHSYIAQGFLPSHVSHSVSIVLEKGEKDRFTIIPKTKQKVKKPIQKIIKKLNQYSSKTKLRALSPLLNIAPIGKSFHLGGSLPMTINPNHEFETNTLGESPGLPNVHIIDSSVFPDIASGPITYTMMANAYRIVEEVILG